MRKRVISTENFLPGSRLIVNSGDFFILEDDLGKIVDLEISSGAGVSHSRRVASQLKVSVSGEYSLDLKISETGKNSVQIYALGDSSKISVSEILQASSGTISSTVSISVQAPRCQVTHRVKAVARGAGTVKWTGAVEISENAEEADASQVAKGLPLEGGKIIFEPTLDIKNKNVKVKHGAAILQDLGARQKLFLTNRGVSEKQADEILLVGFLSSYFFLVLGFSE